MPAHARKIAWLLSMVNVSVHVIVRTGPTASVGSHVGMGAGVCTSFVIECMVTLVVACGVHSAGPTLAWLPAHAFLVFAKVSMRDSEIRRHSRFEWLSLS